MSGNIVTLSDTVSETKKKVISGLVIHCKYDNYTFYTLCGFSFSQTDKKGNIALNYATLLKHVPVYTLYIKLIEYQ